MKLNDIHFRVTDEDKKEIKREASKLGLSISAYLMYLHKSKK